MRSPRSTLSRRGLLGLAAGAAAAAALPLRVRDARASEPRRHFFLHVLVSGGLDQSYLFDARPLRMTEKNRITNYLLKNSARAIPAEVDAARVELVGANGTKALRTRLTDPLMKHWPDFSVLNGVLMSKDADGHGNSTSYALTGQSNPGFDSFVPMLGARSERPIESVLFGFLPDGPPPGANFSKSIHFMGGAAGGVGAALKTGPRLDREGALFRHVQARQLANADGAGMISTGARKLHAALRAAPELSDALQKAGAAAPVGVDLLDGLAVALEYFRSGVTSAATVVYMRDPILDVHGAASAQTTQMELLGGPIGSGAATTAPGVTQNLAQLFDVLKSTPVDPADPNSPSFFEATTVCIHSEFSRTLVNLGSPATVDVGATGTDHNPLTNSVLLAGRGIRGGLVLGESDCRDVDDEGKLVGVSRAHLAKESAADERGIYKLMGKPFDFATGRPREDLPEVFRASDYLNFPSVVNTVMAIFGIDRQEHFRIDGVQAPVLDALVKS